MRFFKLIAVVLILGLIGLFIYQNVSILTAPLSFKLSFYISTPLVMSLSVYALAITTTVIGLILGLAIMLKPFLNLRRQLAQERQEKPEEENKVSE
jgi:hypothetical protein